MRLKIQIILTVTFTDPSFHGKLYNIGGDGPIIKKNMADKIAGSRLEYDNLRNLYPRFGRKWLFSVLMKLQLSIFWSVPRVTYAMKIISAIVQHFIDAYKDSSNELLKGMYFITMHRATKEYRAVLDLQ